MDNIPPSAPRPRLCHMVKRPNFSGYGFNLHAEKAKPGQFIGKVDENSPAEAAGLNEEDRIIEVNGVNISQENHKQVVTRIKAIPDETRLLVVDKEAEDYYKNAGIIVRSTLPNVLRLTSSENDIKEEPQVTITTKPIKKEEAKEEEEAEETVAAINEAVVPMIEACDEHDSPRNNRHVTEEDRRSSTRSSSSTDKAHEEKEIKMETPNEPKAPIIKVDEDNTSETLTIEATIENSHEEEEEEPNPPETKGVAEVPLEPVEPEKPASVTCEVQNDAKQSTMEEEEEELPPPPMVEVCLEEDKDDHAIQCEPEVEVKEENKSNVVVVEENKTEMTVISLKVERNDSASSGHASMDKDEVPVALPPVEKPLSLSSDSGSSARSTPSPIPAALRTNSVNSDRNNWDGLNLNITAKEMRARIGSKKKRDPRKDERMDIRKKYEIIQTL